MPGTDKKQRVRRSARVLLSCSLVLLTAQVADSGVRTGAQETAPDGRAALQAAVALVQQGRLDEADRQAQVALSDPETKAVAYSVLGTIRLQQNRLEDSVKLLHEAIRLEPRLLGAQLSLAHVHTVRNEPELAFARYRAVFELDPSNPAARLALARAEIEKGNYRGSLELAQPVAAVLKQSAEGLFVLATALLKSGEGAAARELADDWVRLADVPQEWSIRFGLLLAREGAASEGIAVLEHAKQTSAPTYELAFNLGGAYVIAGDVSRALDYYDRALSLRPDSVDALRQAALVAERNGELERSLSYWMRAKKLAPDDAGILLGFGRVCLKMDLLEDAEPALTRAASLKPKEISYQYTLAAAKVGKRQYEAAQHLLDPLLRERPDDAHLQYAMGTILYTQGHPEQAVEHLRRSVSLQPEQLASYFYLALAVRDLGRDTEAIEILERLLARHPDHAASCEVLGGLLMTAHRHQEAELYLRTAVRLNPQSVRANYQLGLLLARMGRKEDADKQLAHAKTLREEDEASSRLQLRLLDPDQ
jgi:tetratricopeptide (TPR) repeat protein